MSFHIGVDLGTTNCVVAYRDLNAAEGSLNAETRILPMTQRVSSESVEARSSLPSFVYLPRDSEVDRLRDQWTDDPVAGVVGVYARQQSIDHPGRVVVAAKSWLSHGKGTEAILPWQSTETLDPVSASHCTSRLLSHLVSAWTDAHPDAPIDRQHVVLTVPASFDPSARELTRRAALAAGFPDDFVLLEEPQAAVYRWLAESESDWRQKLGQGDRLLVVDVGGGTTDLTLIRAGQIEGALELDRVAVGQHLLLGGDNMDLALAHFVAGRFAENGHQLDPWQSTSLWHACRNAKETLLSEDAPQTQTISVLGRGSSLIGGTISTEITKDEARAFLVDGFFPVCEADKRPMADLASGFQDVGLPFESDAAITRHIAAFLADHADEDGQSMPTHVLLNGGVFRSEALRQRLCETLAAWCDHPPTILGGTTSLDTAVAAGAAYYSQCKSEGGIRIRGGTARSYYIGIETSGLAIPGVPRPLRALCVAPRGMEEGTEANVPSQSVGVVVGRPAAFRFFASPTREDQVGSVVQQPPTDEVYETEPISVTLTVDEENANGFVPVQFVSRITELGMFELWCHSTAGEERWKMEFNVRED